MGLSGCCFCCGCVLVCRFGLLVLLFVRSLARFFLHLHVCLFVCLIALLCVFLRVF